MRGCLLLWLVACMATVRAAPPAAAVDASGRHVALARPALRIVSLAPHVTEMLFAIGAGRRVVATVAHADFPPAAQALPHVGDAFNVNLEAIAALQPDLVVLWISGTGRGVRERLDALAVPTFGSEPARLAGVAEEMLALGALAGVDASAAVIRYRQALALALARRTADGRSAFVQIGAPSIFTVGDKHFIGEALSLCGARNVFAGLRTQTAQVSREAVLERRADVYLLMDDLGAGERDQWISLGVAPSAIAFLPGDLLTRPGPRLADGVVRLCAALAGAAGR